LTGRPAEDYDTAMRWWERRAVLLVVVAALFLAPVAGAAMVPDPTWIGGMYDGGDGDEVAILVWDLTSGIVPTVVAPPAPVDAILVDVPEPIVVVSAPLPQPASRAPPRV
jgi:hypothetical protein